VHLVVYEERAVVFSSADRPPGLSDELERRLVLTPQGFWTTLSFGPAQMDSRNASPWVSLDLHPSARVFAFTLMLCVLTAAVFGLVPALRASKVSLAEWLVSRGADAGARGRMSLGKSLVAIQVALSLVLVVATGGLSIPKMGATGLAYDLARQFGLRVIEPRPGLVPLLLDGAEGRWTELAGVAADVVASADGGPGFREKLLVTHRGLSGPAVLQASSYWRKGRPLVVDLAPDADVLKQMREPRARRDAAAFRQALRERMPQRLAGHLAEAGPPEGWSNAALEACERRLHGWAFHPVGTEGFEKAEVTAGGVDTAGLQSRTMEARAVPGLFFIGEAVDVTGWLGGFNFQWAWASAVAAGRAV